MIGRKEEINKLNELYESNKAELVAVYGRKRVGKTYLIDETFKNCFTFRHAGLSPFDEEKDHLLEKQLNQFYRSLILYGCKETEAPKDWYEAFFMLENLLEKKGKKRLLVFLDELPWLDTPRSNFINAFEGFWNNYACHKDNLMVVVCGSATSWIENKLINNHGGLYNRITYEMKLSPFSLKECEEYYKSNKVVFTRYDVVQSYMIFGGIPYYMSYIDRHISLAQNVDKLFFEKNAKLKFEYDRLFSSMFSNPETIKKLVEYLSTRNMGYTRKEIIKKLNISNGGSLTSSLNSLIASDFIISYVPFGFNKRETHYKLIDPFCLFYLRFLTKQKKTSENYFEQNITSPSVNTWRGLAYENVCFNHIKQIKKALGISGVISNNSAWISKEEDNNVQIDLLIQRNDNVVDMCEIKFYSGKFKVDKNYYQTILERQTLLTGKLSKKEVVHNVLITTFDVDKNQYSNIFNNIITIDDLFD